jgi:site-specific recombinase XerD
MLEQYFKLDAVLRRHRGGLLGPYLDSFVSLVAELRYPRETVRRQCCVLKDLGLWLESHGLGVVDLDEELVNRHLKDRRRSGKVWRGDEAATIRLFVGHLRALAVVATPEAVGNDSPLEHILRRYTKFLLEERAVLQATVDYYLPFVRSFLDERFGDGPLRLRELGESDVTDFVLSWARSQKSGTAKLLVTVLRSFFRFLLEHGEIELDLAAAVPSVANWRLSTLPKCLSQEEIEQVLKTCDRGTALGRRNYAILLLLARLGLRACEVARLELDDIDWRAGQFTVRGKGLQYDQMPLTPEVGEALEDYIRRDRPACSTRRVFIRVRAPIREIGETNAVSTVVRRAIHRAGLKTPAQGAHLLRHSLATNMLRSGASMAEIAQLLRHRSPITTEIYAKVDFDALRRLAQPWPTLEDGR